MSFLFGGKPSLSSFPIGIWGKKSEDVKKTDSAKEPTKVPPNTQISQSQMPPAAGMSIGAIQVIGDQQQQNQPQEELKLNVGSDANTFSAAQMPKNEDQSKQSAFSFVGTPQQQPPQQTAPISSTDYQAPFFLQGITPSQQQPQQLNTSGNSSSTMFGGLNLNKPAAAVAPSTNPLFAGLNLGAPKPVTEPEKQKGHDLFSGLGLPPQPAGTTSYHQASNPYQKQSIGEFNPLSFMQGSSFQAPPSTLETPKAPLPKDDPFAFLTMTAQTTGPLSQQAQVSSTGAVGGGSLFDFLNTSKSNKQIAEQKDINDTSVSSINNVSKHSFEEVDKNEHLGNNASNMSAYLQPHSNSGTQEYQHHTQTQSVNQSNSLGAFQAMLNPNHQSQNAPSFSFLNQRQQQQPETPMTIVNDNDGKGNDSNDDNFEEINESREIIEDRINRIKLQIIDFTVKQQEISEKVLSLTKDNQLLAQKLEDISQQQARAIENEDYEEAEALNMKFTQTKNLISAKDSQIKQFDEEHMLLENKKTDKAKELSNMLHKSIEKVDAIRIKQNEDMGQFEEAETTAIEDKRKRLHYESIRIEEIKKEVRMAKEKVTERLQIIEDKVVEDTKPQQQEKSEVEEKIRVIDNEIEELEQLVEKKRKERDQFYITKQTFEREIDKSRAKYRDQILKLEKELDKVQRDEDKNYKEAEEQKVENSDLQDYEENFKSRLKSIQLELKELDDFERALKKNADYIDSTLSEKVACKDKSYQIKTEINGLNAQREQIINGKELFKIKITKLEGEIDELNQNIDACDKKLIRLEKDKKKFAADKKFKEAGKCQNEIKETTSEQEEAQAKLKVSIKEKERMEVEAGSQDSIIEDLDKQLKQKTVIFEQEQLKLLTYRKEDTLDLLQSLKNMQNVQNAQKRSEMLENELLKIDNELFELEKKYGEFNIKKGKIRQPNIDSSKKQVEIQQVMAEEEVKEQIKEQTPQKWDQAPPIESSQFAIPSYDEQPDIPQINETRRFKSEVDRDISNLKNQIAELEAQMEAAAEQEDYDKAEELQNQIDDIQSNQIPPFIDELLNAQEDEEPNPPSTHSELEDQQEINEEDEPYEPPSLGLFSGMQVQKEDHPAQALVVPDYSQPTKDEDLAHQVDSAEENKEETLIDKNTHQIEEYQINEQTTLQQQEDGHSDHEDLTKSQVDESNQDNNIHQDDQSQQEQSLQQSEYVAPNLGLFSGLLQK